MRRESPWVGLSEAEPDPHHGPAPELRGGDTIAADRNAAHGDVCLAAHYGLNSDIALGLKSAKNLTSQGTTAVGAKATALSDLG
jgi:hypothetical protein